jgi:hypothetical protein
MSTRWNFEKQEQLKGYLDAAHKAAKDYLSVHSEADSAVVYRLADDAAKEYSKNLSIRDTQSIGDYTIAFIREMLTAEPLNFPAKTDTTGKKRGCSHYGNVGLPKEKVEQIQELIRQGHTYKEIMTQCEVAAGTITNIKKKMKTDNQKEETECKPVELDSNKQLTSFSDILNIISCLVKSGANRFSFSLPVNGKEYMVSFSEVTSND